MTCNEAFNTAPKTLCAIQVERNPLVGSGAARGGGGGEEGGGGQQDYILFALDPALHQSSGAVLKSRCPSWAFRPNEHYGFCGRKATLNHAYALVTVCP